MYLTDLIILDHCVLAANWKWNQEIRKGGVKSRLGGAVAYRSQCGSLKDHTNVFDMFKFFTINDAHLTLQLSEYGNVDVNTNQCENPAVHMEH